MGHAIWMERITGSQGVSRLPQLGSLRRPDACCFSFFPVALVLLLSATSLLTATQAEAQTVPTDVLGNDALDISNFNVTPGDEKLDLTWQHVSVAKNAQWVQYKRQTDTDWTTSTHTLAGTVTSYSITSLTNGIPYDVRVFGTASSGGTTYRGKFATGTGTPLASTLDAPTNLGVTVGNAQLGLTWTAPSGTVAGYDVHYTSASSGTVSNTANASGNDPSTAWVAVTRTEADPPTASQTISSLTNDTPYRVRVRAKNKNGGGRLGVRDRHAHGQVHHALGIFNRGDGRIHGHLHRHDGRNRTGRATGLESCIHGDTGLGGGRRYHLTGY